MPIGSDENYHPAVRLSGTEFVSELSLWGCLSIIYGMTDDDSTHRLQQCTIVLIKSGSLVRTQPQQANY